MISIEKVEYYINKVESDISKRFNDDIDCPPIFDQKIQPDVLEIVAECILEHSKRNNIFTVKDIWRDSYTRELCKSVFKKGDPLDPKKASEWEKCFAQPLNTLSFFEILFKTKPKKGRGYIFTIVNKEMLEYISRNSRNSHKFIYLCSRSFLKKNNLETSFFKFKEKQNSSAFNDLKDLFINEMKNRTKARKKPLVDIKNITRIFTPIVNALAFELDMFGTYRGRCSPEKILFSDLSYNRPNFSDVATNKPKNMSRKEWRKQKILEINEQVAINGSEAASKEKVRRRHMPVSEYSNEDDATQIHHIFP